MPRRSQCVQPKRIRVIMTTIFRWLSLLSLLFILLVTSLWLFGPRLFSFNSSKNILFVTDNLDLSKSNFYLAQYREDSTNKSLQLSSVALTRVEKSQLRFVASWELGLLVDQVIALPVAELSQQSDLIKALRAKLLKQEKFSWRSTSFLLKTWFSTRQVKANNFEFVASTKLQSKLNQEANDCALAVVNTTSANGLAGAMAEILEQNGGRVVRITDQDQFYQQSVLSYEVMTQTQLHPCRHWIERLPALFFNQPQVEDQPTLGQKYRADLVIMLGQDLAENLEKVNLK